MAIPRDDPLKREARQAAQQALPARGIHIEKQVEGNVLTLADVTPAGIGAATQNHGHLKNLLDATTDPGVDDDSTLAYAVGSIWINVTADSVWQCTDATAGAAVWKDLSTQGAGGGDADAIHDNVASEISAITEKATPVNADLGVIEDSEAANAKKRVQVGNLPVAGELGGTLSAATVDATHSGSAHHDEAHTHSISKSYIFEFPDTDLALGDFIPENAIRVPAAGKHGTIILGTAYARCEVVGTGTNTILVRTSTTLTGARTTRGTINLDTAREADTGDMVAFPSDGNYIWAECSAVGATAPQKVTVQVDAEEISYGQA